MVSLMTGSVVSNIASQGARSSPSFAGLPTNNTYSNDTTGLNDTLVTTPYVPTVESAKDDLIMQKLALASSMCFLVGVVQVSIHDILYIDNSRSGDKYVDLII